VSRFSSETFLHLFGSRYAYILLVAGIIVMPIAITIAKVLLVLGVALRLLALVLSKELLSKKDFFYALPIAIFLLWHLVCVLYSPYSSDGIASVVVKLPLILYVIAFLGLRIESDMLLKCMKYISISLFVIFLYLLFKASFQYQKLQIGAVFFNESLARPIMHPGYLSYYYLMPTLFWMQRFFAHPNRRCFLYLIAVGLPLFMLISKVSYIVFFLFLIVLIVQGLRRRYYSLKQIVIGFAFFCAAAYLLISSTTIQNRFIEIGNAFKSDYSKVTAGHSTPARVLLWRIALGYIAKEPVWGYGTGAGRNVLDNHYVKHDMTSFHKYKLNSHNQYLHFLLDNGLVGLMIFVIAMIAYAKHFWQNRIYFGVAILFAWAAIFATDDMLEVQAGTMLFGFYIALAIAYANSKLAFANLK
jgi:O-antigen ligase